MAAGRGRKVATTLIVLLLILVGLFVAADRIASYAASQTLATQAQKELTARQISTPDKPTVVVDGFPFLTQVARGRYDKVTIHATKLTTNGVRIDTLDVTATGINAAASVLMSGNGTVTADNVAGTARIGWDSVTTLIKQNVDQVKGVTVSALPTGQVQLHAPISAFGLSATVVATGTLQVQGDNVHVKITDVKTEGGNLPQGLSALVSSLKTALSVDVKIPTLPYHLKIRSVHPDVQGIVVTAEAQNVPIAGQPGA
jgi:hypothetical protein